MKEWRKCSGWAAQKLPGFPTTKAGVLNFIKKAGIREDKPNLVRRCNRPGGGLEYHYSILPKNTRNTYVIRNLQSTEAQPIDEIFADAHSIPEPPSSEAAELRRDAILVILNFWDIYRVKSTSSMEMARFEFVTMYQNEKITGIPEWVRNAMTTQEGHKRGMSVSTLRRWEERRNKGEFSMLAGKYGNRKGTGKLDNAEGGKVATFIASRIVHQPHLTADHLRDLTTAEFGDTLEINGEQQAMPPIRTFQRFISKWKAEHHEALAKMTDPDAYKSKIKFAGTNMNHWVRRPNQLWEIDASPADILLTDGRYSIYAVVDIYTRRMMVTVTKTPKTSAVLALMRVAIQAWGVPEILRTDNGSDFVSYEFKRALSSLAIHHDITDPFSPEQKGTVERHIGTLQRGLMPLLPGFVGHNVTDRKKIEARRSFAKRLGESDQDAFCVDLGHEELQSKINRWVEMKYEHSPHGGLNGKTPFEMIAVWTGPIRKIENERALDILLTPLGGKDGIRVVTKFGITLDKAKFIHPDLIPGSRVLVRLDPEDMGRIYVYSTDGHEFICIAECPERLGIDPGTAVRAAREAQAERVANEIAPLQQEIKRIKPRDMIDSVLSVAESKNATLTAFPKATEAYSSEGLDAADAAVKASQPTPISEISEEDQAYADRVFEELNAEPEPTNVVPLRGEDERPFFDNDIDFVKWVLTSKKATDDDRAYAAELTEKSPTIRLALGAD